MAVYLAKVTLVAMNFMLRSENVTRLGKSLRSELGLVFGFMLGVAYIIRSMLAANRQFVRKHLKITRDKSARLD